jgi:hypothetical protein
MIFDTEAMRNAQTRIRNLDERSPFDAWKRALEAFIEMLTAVHLDGVPQEERQERRKVIREAQDRLLELLSNPQELYYQSIEERRTQ